MRLIGYARVSTDQQNLDAQIDMLKEAGVMNPFSEKASGKQKDRPQLEAALNAAIKGDTFVVTRLDRLARNTTHLHELSDRLKDKGVALKVLTQDIDTSTPAGALFFTIMSGIAEFETETRAARQAEGIAKAKERGAYKGAKQKINEAHIRELVAKGMNPTDIAQEMDIARSSVYRYLPKKGAA